MYSNTFNIISFCSQNLSKFYSSPGSKLLPCKDPATIVDRLVRCLARTSVMSSEAESSLKKTKKRKHRVSDKEGSLTKHASDFFCTVPRRQLMDILCEWVDIANIGRLDSATCNSTSRKSFLDFLRADCYVFRGRIGGNFADSFYHWTIKRQVKMAGFSICAALASNHILRQQYLANTGRTIRSVDFNHVDKIEKLDLHWYSDSDSDNEEEDDPRRFVCTTQQLVYDIAAYCPSLTHLEMAATVLDSTICLLLLKCPLLQSLNISKCFGVSSSILRSICEHPSITVLDMSSCNILPHALDYDRRPCLSLRTLKAQYCNLSTDDLTTILCLFPNLTSVYVTLLDPNAFGRIVKSCPMVTVAVITLPSAISDSTALEVCKKWSGIVELTLVMQNVRNPQAIMSETALLAILTKCKALQRLVLRHHGSYAHQFADSAAALMSPSSLLKSTAVRGVILESVVLTPACLGELHDLHAVILDKCSGLTDASLASLAQRCPHLRSLCVRNCPELTANAVIEVIGHCPELTSLTFLTLGNSKDTQLISTPLGNLINALVKKWCPLLTSISIS